MSEQIGTSELREAPADRGAARPRARDERLPMAHIGAYSLPVVWLGSLGLVQSLYLMKFATDVLLIAPAVMGMIYGLGRIWDAISDPLAGYLSDRSQARRGRRRSWMYASAVPIGVGTVMLWSPPDALGPVALVAWIGVAYFAYETANTAFQVPHGALGVELTSNYHERTRLFGYRHLFMAVGMIFGVAGFEWLRRADDQRAVAFAFSVIFGVALTATILYTTMRLPERSEYSGRGSDRITKAFADVLRNPHARLILIVYGVETFGSSSLALLATYVMQYVIAAPEMTTPFILLYFVPQFAFTPMWMALSRRVGKKHLWVFSMSMLTIGYSCLFFVRDYGTDLLFVTAGILGLGGGCGMVVAPSVKADVIDYDEYLTGERKEGAYLAVWNFVRKAAMGLSAMMTGFVLQWIGFEPNVEQSESTKNAMMMLFSFMPAGGYLIGTLIFLRFRFNEREHARVREILDERNRAFRSEAGRFDPPN